MVDKDMVAVHKDLLFVAMTRVPTVFGVPYFGFVLELMVGSLMNVMTGNPLYLLIVIPVHGVMYAISVRDPGIFKEIEIWTKTIGRCLNRGFWDAASFSPVVVSKWKK